MNNECCIYELIKLHTLSTTSVGGLTWGYMGFSNFTNGAYAPFKFVTGIGNIEGDKTKPGEVLETVIYVENQ